MNAEYLSRRSFLRSAGFLLGLPAFESLTRVKVNAAGTLSAGVTASGDPLRLALLYVPNGVNVERWTPRGQGADFSLNETMLPLGEFQRDVQVVSGLEHHHGWANGDGGGDHARASATIFTGARPKKTAGTDIRAGISVDQVAARQLEGRTRFASLELSCDGVRQRGIVIQVIPARINSTSHGVLKRSLWHRSLIHALCLNVCLVGAQVARGT